MAQSQQSRKRTEPVRGTARARTAEIDEDEGSYEAVAKAPSPAGLYRDASTQIDKALELLDYRIGQLYTRLGPVMVAYDDGAEPICQSDTDRADGQVVEQVRDWTAKLYVMAATVDSIHRRLVLAEEG